MSSLSSLNICLSCLFCSEIFKFFVNSVQREIAEQVVGFFLTGRVAAAIQHRLLHVARRVEVTAPTSEQAHVLRAFQISRSLLFLKSHRGQVFGSRFTWLEQVIWRWPVSRRVGLLHETQRGLTLRTAAHSGEIRLRRLEVRDGRVVILEQVGVLERVRSVGYLLERLALDLLPVVRWLVQHEHPVAFHVFDRRPHLWVALENLAQQVPRRQVNALFVQTNLACNDLLLELHRVILFQEGQRPIYWIEEVRLSAFSQNSLRPDIAKFSVS